MSGYFVLTVGTLAYIDSFSGLVPCKVTEVHNNGEVSVRVTANRKEYTKGEVFKYRPGTVIPRTAVYTKNGQYHIAPFVTIAHPQP